MRLGYLHQKWSGRYRLYTPVFYSTDNRETNVTASWRDMGDAWVGSSAGSEGNKVSDDLHRETTGNCGTVGNVATNI